MNQSQQKVDELRVRSWNAAMSSVPGKLDLRIPASSIKGAIPSALHGGSFLSNGPGWTKIGGRIAHPFDGHGYVRSFRFLDDGSCAVRARFVETKAYQAESAAQRMVVRGFATNLDGGALANIGFGSPRNVANTTITRWGEKLLAGWEGGAPHALHPESLSTIGEETFDGLLTGQATLAHMHKDYAQKRMVLCSMGSLRDPSLTFREIDEKGRLLSVRRAKVPGPFFLHDFAITPNWYVVGGNPLRVLPSELLRMAVGRSTLLRSVAANTKQPGVFYLIPRRPDGAVRTIRLPDTAFVVHFANAFERDDSVFVDACAFRSYEFGAEFGYTGPSTPFDPSIPDQRPPQRLYRVTIRSSSDDASWEQLVPYGVDFPRVHPEQEGRDVALLFGACRADPRYSDPFDSLVSVSLRDRDRPSQLWSTPSNVFVGEPIFVPDAAHDDRGHVLAMLSDGNADRSTLAIFDASALSAGPIASIELPLLPVAFHGDWDGAPLRD